MLETVFAPRVPAGLAKLAVLSVYEPGDEDERFLERVEIVEPDGSQMLVSNAISISIGAAGPEAPVAHRSLHMLWGVRFNSFGDHLLSIQKAADESGPWESVGRRVIRVSPGSLPLQPQGQQPSEIANAASVEQPPGA